MVQTIGIAAHAIRCVLRIAELEMLRHCSSLFIFIALLNGASARAEPLAPHTNAVPTNRPAIESDGLKSTSAKSRSAPPDKTATETGVATKTSPIPDDYKINLLIRTTIIAVNQANITGNYSVLRDLGAPGFQAANTAAQLAENFANQRKSKFDLSPILFFDPQLIQKPLIDPAGRLRVSGFFATKPQQVNFDLAFENVDGEWRHFGLGIGTQLAVKPRKPAAP